MSDRRQWQFDQSRNTHYYIDHERRLFVYQNGEEIPFEQPRSANLPQRLPTANPAPGALQASQRRSNYTHGTSDTRGEGSRSAQARPESAYQSTSSSRPRRESRSAMDNLTTTMDRLAVDPPGQEPARPINAIPEHVTQTLQQGVRTVEVMDPRNMVSTRFSTPLPGRSAEITDPLLYSQGVRAHQMLHGTGQEGDTERLFLRYRVRPRNFFHVGRVFMVLWVEPAGETASMITSIAKPDRPPDPSLGTGRYGEAIFSKVRRFVIIREAKNFCSALPVTTYGGQGVAKSGVTKSEHGIIFTGTTPPEPRRNERPRRGEQGMRPRAIRVIADNPTDSLDEMSRIGYALVHSIHHNIKCMPLGQVHQNSTEALLSQFYNCWTRATTLTDPPIAGPSRGALPILEQRLRARQELERQREEDRLTRESFDALGRQGHTPEQAFDRMVQEWVRGGWTRDAATSTLRAQLSRTQRVPRSQPPTGPRSAARRGRASNVDAPGEDDEEEEDDEDDQEDDDEEDDDDDDDDEDDGDDESDEEQRRQRRRRGTTR